MIKRIGILGLCMMLVLTGCGMPDAVADEMEAVCASAGFTGDVKNDYDSFSEAVARGEEHTETLAVSQKMGERMEALAVFLEKAKESELIEVDAEDWEEMEEEEEEKEEEEEEGETDGLSEQLSELKDWRSHAEEKKSSFLGSKSSIYVCFSVERKRIGEFIQGMTEIGFDGLALPNAATGGCTTRQVLQGMIISLENYEDDAAYEVTIEIPTTHFAYPDKYKDLIENHMRDAFIVNGIFCGGDLELVSFSGSSNSPVNRYIKDAEVCFKDGKALQMNITIEEDSPKKGDPLFTDKEKEELTALIAWMTGDAEGSGAFVDGLGKNSESSGTLGSRKWYRTWRWADGTELVRFQ